MLTDVNALKNWINQHGLKKGFIAEKLGITLQGLLNKIENKSEFKASEIAI